jgi:hypothetical protein
VATHQWAATLRWEATLQWVEVFVQWDLLKVFLLVESDLPVFLLALVPSLEIVVQETP